MVGDNIVNVKKFKTTNELLKKLNRTQSPLILTKNDDAVAVVQDIEHYSSLMDALNFLKLMVQGEKEFQEGKGRDQEEVFDNLIRTLEARRGTK